MFSTNTDRAIVEESLAQISRWRLTREIEEQIALCLRDLELARRDDHFAFFSLAPWVALEIGVVLVIAGLGLGLVVYVLTGGLWGAHVAGAIGFTGWNLMLIVYLFAVLKGGPARANTRYYAKDLRTMIQGARRAVDRKNRGRVGK